jgi:hypothetical protein
MDVSNYENPARSYKKSLRMVLGMIQRKAPKIDVPNHEQPALSHEKSLSLDLGVEERKAPKMDLPNHEQPVLSHEKSSSLMEERKAPKMDVPNHEHSAPSHETSISLDLGMRERNQLCSSCSKIDFKSIFALSSKKVGRHGIALTETRTDIQSGCDLCSLVASMASLKVIPTSGSFIIPFAGYHLRALDSLWPLRLERTDELVAMNPGIVVAVVQGKGVSEFSKPERLKEAISRGFIVPITQHSSLEPSNICPFSYRARTVSRTEVDFTRICSWLRECQESKSDPHHRCKSQPRRITFSARVIDCETREIVPLTPDLEYLALSYVWGNNPNDAEVDQTAQSDFRLPNPAPQTIEDAMAVVRRLQKRYLWVDRYCIRHSEDRHLQIQNMDQIYQNALTTIVAADGDNTESGLRGVSCLRQHQFSFRTNAGILAYTFPHVSYHLSTSTWGTRGWTYQEAILSRSCLFFTKDQVYFACKTHLRSEAVEQKRIVHHDRTREVLAPRLMRFSDQATFSMIGDGLSPFHEHLREYTSRTLGRDSDALNAFKGIIASLSAYTYWGISFSDTCSRRPVPIGTSEAVFAQNLAWVGKRLPPGRDVICRRRGFPTWSWTSLVDQIEAQHKNHVCLVPKCCSAFYVEDSSQNWLRITDVLRDAQERETLIIPERGTALLVEALVTEVCLRSTSTEGRYSLHHPKSLTPDSTWTYLVSGSRIWGDALIDRTDADLLSRIESQPWSAIKLFNRSGDGYSYWMLVDQCDPVARRIGLIRSCDFDKGEMMMDSLNPKRRWTRIE